MKNATVASGYSLGNENKSGISSPPRIPLPVPLPLVQPVLARLVRRVARGRPELFRRLGPHCEKSFLIDPVNLPFAFMLRPHPEKPSLRAHRRTASRTEHDARIAGSLLSLLEMIDGGLDGDALFFSRSLVVEGDVEAVVALRNALDDLEGSVADDLAGAFGPPGRLALALLRRRRRHGRRD